MGLWVRSFSAWAGLCWASRLRASAIRRSRCSTLNNLNSSKPATTRVPVRSLPPRPRTPQHVDRLERISRGEALFVPAATRPGEPPEGLVWFPLPANLKTTHVRFRVLPYRGYGGSVAIATIFWSRNRPFHAATPGDRPEGLALFRPPRNLQPPLLGFRVLPYRGCGGLIPFGIS